ncbi:MAG: hypothetical protein A3K83_04485 [Omnitrophica WOR_2 bacterium RBG_13_44_8b]|nr:MAG: hypothetical protein A3K83_04485 [Omnitrophica WOR_2 bacterium RBG_13_44_8b]
MEPEVKAVTQEPVAPEVQQSEAEVVRKAVEEAKSEPAIEKAPIAEEPQTEQEISAEEKAQQEAAEKARIKARIQNLSRGTVPQQQAQQYQQQVEPTDIQVRAHIDNLIAEGNVADAMRVQSDWSAKRERERVIQELTTQNYINTSVEQRNKANASVWERHPEVLDVDEGKLTIDKAPFYQAMQQVYMENPDLLEIAKGPEICMELAEKRLGHSGENVRKAKIEGAKAENQRAASAQAAGIVSSAGVSGTPPRSVPISKEEQAIARKLGLSDDDYGKYRKRSSVFDKAYYDKYKGEVKPKK